jgi:hypothetical protein
MSTLDIEKKKRHLDLRLSHLIKRLRVDYIRLRNLKIGKNEQEKRNKKTA